MTENVLSQNQRKALAALLANKTQTDAAQACGLQARTIRRYLDDPFFRRALAQAEGRLIDQAGRVLIVGQKQALEVLRELMTGAENESTRRLAAANWLDYCLRYRELTALEVRVAQLEQLFYEKLT